MNNLLLKSVMTVLVVLCSLNAFAYDVKIDGIYYNLDNDAKTAAVTSGDNKYSGDITIPESILYDDITYPVRSIDGDAFSGCSGLTSVTISSGVTSIRARTFYGCSSLISVTIPSSVTSIGSDAFQGCTSLTSVTIPSSVTSIGSDAFWLCIDLTSVTIEDGAEPLSFSTSSSSTPFSICPIEKLYLGRNITYSSSLSPFKGKEKLRSLTIGNNVTSIGSEAFSGCRSLASVTIPSSVTSIGYDAFWLCSGLTSVTIEDGAEPLSFSTTSSGTPFTNCPIENLYLGRNISFSSSYSPFRGKEKRISLTIGNGVTSIGSEAFSGCSGLTSVTIPSSVTSIGSLAFFGCSGLTSVTIPGSVTSIGSEAFSGCSGLISVTIPSSVTSIETGTFDGCSGLKSVYLPDGILSMGNDAFDKETKLYVNEGSQTLLTFWNKNKKGKYYSPYDKASDKEILPPSFIIAPTTQTTALVEIENWCEGFTYKYNGEETTERKFYYTKLKPGLTRNLTLAVKKDDACYNVTGSFTTKSLSPRIEPGVTTASSIKATGAYTEEDAKVIAQSIRIDNMDVHRGNEVFACGLNPGGNYIVQYSIEVDYGGEETATYTGTSTISTQRLQVNMAQPKVVSEGNVIVSATTNLYDEETNVGFEWRCTDWTDEFPSNTGTAYLYDGMIEGNIKNLNTNKLWKCRPYYLSDSGVYNYGDWMGIDPTNTSYFEPTIHTYSKVTIKGNTALIRGYALSGTDEVKVQGFKYWKTKGGSGHLNKVVAVPTDAMTVELNNKQQSLSTTLSGLEYDSEYCCVAFVTTTDGNTFYGEEQKFITGANPTGIESIDVEKNSEESSIEVARYNMEGQQIDVPQKGVNIIRMSDGTTKKVYVK